VRYCSFLSAREYWGRQISHTCDSAGARDDLLDVAIAFVELLKTLELVEEADVADGKVLAAPFPVEEELSGGDLEDRTVGCRVLN